MAEKALQPIPEGMHTITPQLWFNGNCNEAIEFYKKAFGAELMAPPAVGPEGKGIMHAMLKWGTSPFMMADAWPGWETGPQSNATAGFWIYVENVDTVFDKAVAAGCEVVFPVMDAFWGDRTGKFKDPFGHCWAIASHQWNYTPEEIQKNQEEWMKSME